jgi:hypothetical protein
MGLDEGKVKFKKLEKEKCEISSSFSKFQVRTVRMAVCVVSPIKASHFCTLGFYIFACHILSRQIIPSIYKLKGYGPEVYRQSAHNPFTAASLQKPAHEWLDSPSQETHPKLKVYCSYIARIWATYSKQVLHFF